MLSREYNNIYQNDSYTKNSKNLIIAAARSFKDNFSVSTLFKFHFFSRLNNKKNFR